jgi:PIN domain nuclease of toxin-antitoxin system
MIAAVADTHAALWYLTDDPRLSAPARALIREATISRNKVAISSISLVEVIYLVEKGRLPITAYEELVASLADPEHVFAEAAVSAAIAATMRQIPRAEVPDMPDRIVAATGLHFGVPVLSRDGRIRAASLKTIW